MNDGATVTGMAGAAPGGHADAEPALDVALGGVAARMPELLPLDQCGGLLELVAVDLGAGGVAGVGGEYLQGIQVRLRRQVVDGAAGQIRSSRVVGRAPGALGAGVDANRAVVLALVGDVGVDVRDLRHAAAGDAAGGPGLRLPAGDGAVLLGAQLDAGEMRGAVAGDLEFGGTVEKELHRPAATLAGELGAGSRPAVGGKLAAESPAHGLLHDVNVGGRQLQLLGQVAADAGDVLGGGPVLHLVPLPLNHLAVGFHAAVRQHRDAVQALRNDLGLLKGLVGIAGDLLAGGLGLSAGLGEVFLPHEMRQHLVFDLDGASGVAGQLLGLGGDRHDFPAGPLDLGPGFGHDVRGGEAFRLLGRAGVDALDAGVGVRTGDQRAEKHAGAVDVGAVLGAAGGLGRPVEAAHAPADHAAIFHWRPAIVRHSSLPGPVWRPREPLAGCPCRCRNGTGCRPSPA